MLKLATGEATRSLELDNSLGQAHAVLGLIREYAWEWTDAEREFKLAIEKAPEYATGYHWYSIYLSEHGRDDQAFTIMKKGAELDPYSPIILTNLAEAYLDKADYASANGVVQKIHDIDPQFFFGKTLRCEILNEEGKTKEALEVLDGIPLAGLSSNNLGFVAHRYAALGEKSKARMILEGLLTGNGSAHQEPVAIAMVYAGLGEADSTIAWIRRAREQRSVLLPNSRAWREFRLVHHDPRYLEVLHSMGLGYSDGEKAK
jgi:tetratricopeptide (TPR) repeat protein